MSLALYPNTLIQVPVEKLVTTYVDKYVDKIVEVPVTRVVEKIVEVSGPRAACPAYT